MGGNLEAQYNDLLMRAGQDAQESEEYMLQISETVHKHMERYSLELQGKLGDLRRAYQSPDTYGQEVIDVLRHQVHVLEARMETLRELDEEIQAIVKKAIG